MASRLVLCLGDLFIPDRAPDIPAKFKKLLIPGKIGQVLCLGNLTSPDAYLFLRQLAPDFHAVKGDFDVDPFPSSILFQPQNPQTQPGAHPGHNQHAQHTHHSQQTPAAGATAPLTKVINHGRLRMGMTHGHTLVPPGDADALLIAARQMDVDVLLWSGGSHRFEAYEMEGRFFVNPGTATGAVGTGWWEDGEEVVPSFVLMDVQGDVLVVYVYQLKKDPSTGEENVSVEKVSYRKNVEPPDNAAATADGS